MVNKYGRSVTSLAIYTCFSNGNYGLVYLQVSGPTLTDL